VHETQPAAEAEQVPYYETAFVHNVARHARTFLRLPRSSVLSKNKMQFILSLYNELMSEIPPAAITPTVLTKPAPLATPGAKISYVDVFRTYLRFRELQEVSNVDL
jgi:hypothetical protein